MSPPPDTSCVLAPTDSSMAPTSSRAYAQVILEADGPTAVVA